MAPKKLSDADKQEILTLYRESEETASSLASQYGVSTSTISRFLKQSLADDEYEALIQRKRSGGKGQLELDVADQDAVEPVPTLVTSPALENEGEEDAAVVSPTTPQRRQRKRSSAAHREGAIAPDVPELAIAPTLGFSTAMEDEHQDLIEPMFASDATVLQELDEKLGEAEEEEEEDDLDTDEDFDDLEEDELEDDEDLAGEEGELLEIAPLHIADGKPLEVLPLAAANIPKTCYLVVDRAAELITRPLKDFGELGQIPEAEVQEKTLPVFDNHRVAKRFMRRMQRVVKIPDGQVLQKVGPYLQAKGITRLLIDGQVYSL